MITYIRPRETFGEVVLASAFGRPVAEQDVLGETVVAYWSCLDRYAPGGEQRDWMFADWAEHLEEPSYMHPYAGSLQDSCTPLFHATIRLHPNDRALTPAEWSHIAHRLARATGVAPPGDERACRWIAVHAQPGRLDLLANLIREDGTWQQQPPRLLRQLMQETLRITDDMGLIRADSGRHPWRRTPHSHGAPASAAPVTPPPDASRPAPRSKH